MAYFANGSQGSAFEDQCERCVFGKRACPIAFVQLEYNYAACGNETASKILDSLVKNDGNGQMYQAFTKELDNGGQLELMNEAFI